MGSRNSQTTVYWVKENIQVVCGCFRGNLIEFKNKVIERYGKGNQAKLIKNNFAYIDQYAIDYLNFIKIVKSIIIMENK